MIIDFSLILKKHLPMFLSGLPLYFGDFPLSFMVGECICHHPCLYADVAKPWLKYPARVYISIMRGVPMLVVLSFFLLWSALRWCSAARPSLCLYWFLLC